MSPQTQQILSDLYALDPGLKDQEELLIKLINELLVSRPDTKFDARFAAELKAKLTERLALVEQPNRSRNNIFSNLNFMKYLLPLAGGALVIVLAIVGLQKSRTMPGARNYASNKTQSLAWRDMGARAFGSLKNSGIAAQGETTESPVPGVAQNNAARGAAPQATGVPSQEQTELLAPTLDAPSFSAGGETSGGAKALPGRLMAPPLPIETYRYVYKGEPLKLEDKEVKVLNREKPGVNKNLDGALRNLQFAGADLGAFSNAGVTNFQLAEDKDNGYLVNVDFMNGTVEMYQNWVRWPQPTEYRPLTKAEVSPDSVLVAVADTFLNDRHIDRSGYEAGAVDDDWGRFKIMAAAPPAPNNARMEIYNMPDVVTVIYQQTINGQKVYEQNGQRVGIRVSVNVRAKQVTGVSGLMTQNYRASSYEAETDAKTILKIAEQGGVYGPVYGYGEDGNQTVVAIELGTPERVYVKMYTYQAKTNDNLELYVPALAFPIKNAPAGANIYQNQVVAPLAKELLTENPINATPLEEIMVR